MRGVVDNPHRFPERFGKIKSHPVFAQMFRVRHDFPVPDRGGKSDRDRVESPIARRILDLLDRLLRRELRTGLKLPALFLLRDHHLDVRAADVDDEDFLHARSLGTILDRRQAHFGGASVSRPAFSPGVATVRGIATAPANAARLPPASGAHSCRRVAAHVPCRSPSGNVADISSMISSRTAGDSIGNAISTRR